MHFDNILRPHFGLQCAVTALKHNAEWLSGPLKSALDMLFSLDIKLNLLLHIGSLGPPLILFT